MRKHYLIVGASSGIGEALIHRLNERSENRIIGANGKPIASKKILIEQ